MEPRPRRYDQDGFPIPPTFDDEPLEQQGPPPARRPSKAPRVLALLAAAGMLAAMFGPQLLKLLRQGMAERLQARAQEKYAQDDAPGALADIERALGWLPDEPKHRPLSVELLFWRGVYRLETHDLEGSLADFNRVVKGAPHFAPAYTQRSVALLRLGRHRESINDATTAIEIMSESDHNALNHRAYFRALAGIELEEALRDIERAIELGGRRAAYLDTRGYVLHLLGNQQTALADANRKADTGAVKKAYGSKQEAALADMNEAIRLTERERAVAEELARSGAPVEAARLRTFNVERAVMYQHRGLIHEKLGHTAEAKHDLDLAAELGYNPALGVF